MPRTQNYADDKDVERFHCINIYTCTRNIHNTSVQASLVCTAFFFLQGKTTSTTFLSEPMKIAGTKTNAKLKNCFKGLTLFLSYILSVNKIFTNVTIQYYILPQRTHIHENGHVECETTLKHIN